MLGLQGMGYGSVCYPRNVALPWEGPEKTNNRAEPMACISALRVAPSSQPLQVATDSKYVHDGVILYIDRWFLLGQCIATQDLWGELRQALSTRRARGAQSHHGSMSSVTSVS